MSPICRTRTVSPRTWWVRSSHHSIGARWARYYRRTAKRRKVEGLTRGLDEHRCNFDRVKTELVSRRIRLEVREQLVSWTLAQIGDVFDAEGFEPDSNHSPKVSGERRSYVERFYAQIDWTNWDACRRFLRVVEAVLDAMCNRQIHDPLYVDLIDAARQNILRLLHRDGFLIDESGSIRAQWEIVTQASVQALPDESAIPGHLRRMWDNVGDRPEQAISAAKDAMESTTKHALSMVGVELTGREKFPELVDRVQRELRLHPTTVAPDQKGADAIIALLGSLANIANKVNEFRNLYGDGHGHVRKVAGLTSRHAQLVARCTDAYVGMILDTLDSPTAPWRRGRDVQ